MQIFARLLHQSVIYGALWAILFVLVIPSPAAAAKTVFDPATCHLAAFVTNDNDIRLDDDTRPHGRRVGIPQAVASQIYAAAKGVLPKTPGDDDGDFTCESLFPDTYRISVTDKLYLFVSELYWAPGARAFFLILYDRTTHAVTKNPLTVDSNWPQNFGAKDPLVRRPFVSFADLFHDGKHQIVFEERVHNGNMYNGVIYHYFSIGSDLSLIPLLERETQLLAFDGDQAVFVRELEWIAPNRLKLETFRVSKSQRTSMGYVILESSPTGSPFRVVSRHPTNADKFDCLVTCMDRPPDETDNDFLNGSDLP